MGDIDFDELDKAVSSLMSSSDAPSSQNKTAVRPVAPKAAAIHNRQSATTKRPSAPKQSIAKPAPKAMDLRFTPNKQAAPAPAVRRSGRFMDVVDSSAEQNPIRQPLTPISRDIPRPPEQTQTVSQWAPEPNIKSMPEQKISTMPVESISEPVSVTYQEPTEEAPKQDSNTESVQVRLVPKRAPEVEPLQLLPVESLSSTVETVNVADENDDEVRPAAVFGALGDSQAPVATSESEAIAVTVGSKVSITAPVEPPVVNLAQDKPVAEPADEQVNLDDLKQSLDALAANFTIDQDSPSAASVQISVPEEDKINDIESPFLSNPEVEKRPLGANLALVGEPTQELAFRSPFDSPELPKQVEPAESLLPMMPHEHPAVSEVPELSNELVALEATGKAEYELDEEPVPIKSSTDGSLKAASAKIENVVGPTSIAQQYQSKESSGDASHAPIYDANDEYTEPVAHPAKKKSGWIWVLAIFLILAIGSGGAVALYLTGIIP